MSKPLVMIRDALLKGQYGRIIQEGLSQHFRLVSDSELDNPASSDLIKETQGMVIFFDKPLDKDTLAKLPNLKVVALPTAAHDYLDREVLRSSGIPASYASFVHTESTAEYAVTLLLSLRRRILPDSAALKAVRDTVSPAAPEKAVLSSGVAGSTVGIVGMGRIGFTIAKMLKGFQVKILYHNRNRRPDAEAEVNATYCAKLHDLLNQSDSVILAAPKGVQTNHMIGPDEFKAMKKSAVIVNIARGSIIKQDALVESLQSGEISGAALDVTDPEPLPLGHPLLDMSNVIVTPHMAWCTEGTMRRMIDYLTKNLLAGIQGKPLPSPVPE